MKTIQKIFLTGTASLLLLSASCGKNSTTTERPCQLQNLTHAGLTVGGANFSAAIAQTDAEQQQGLSNCDEMQSREAMLFDFTTASATQKTFWMKDMRMPLDFIWVAGSVVVGVTESVPAPKPNAADKDLAKIISPTPADTVIEVPAGTVKKYSIKVGDKVRR